jgi:small subunit ribosomal protein S14
MAKESMKARWVKRKKVFEEEYALRKQLKSEGNFEALQKLNRNSSRSRQYNICLLTGRKRGYMRLFGISRVKFRELANQGLIPGVSKASW